MKTALRPALPLLIGIALAAVLALVAMHSLAFGSSAFGSSASAAGSHHSGGYVAVGGHSHDGVDGALALYGGAEATHEHEAHGSVDPAHERGSATHDHGASAVCDSPGDAECCSFMANAAGVPTFAVHAYPGASPSVPATSVPVASLFATEAAERPPSRALLSVLRV